MNFKKVNCYLVDLDYFSVSDQVTYHDVIIPCDVLESVILNEINSCDIIIKEKTSIYLPNEC